MHARQQRNARRNTVQARVKRRIYKQRARAETGTYLALICVNLLELVTDQR